MTTDGMIRRHVDFSFLRSRVARRVFVLFIVAAVAPTIVTALLVFTYVRDQLLDDATRRLAEQSKTYGLERYSRLQQATALLSRIMELTPGSLTQVEHGTAGLMFSRVATVDSQAHVRALIGVTLTPPVIGIAESRRLEQGKAVLATVRQADGTTSVVLLQRTFTPKEAQLWIAELDPEYLWDPLAQPTEPSFAVIDPVGNVLSATDDRLRLLPPDDARQLVARQRGAGQLHVRDQNIVFSSWRIFMRSTFGIDGWTAVVFADQASVLEPLAAFRRIYPQVLSATLLIVILVSLVQIRRSHQPLEKIVDGTRRLAAREFGSPIEVQDNTEFAELAVAFNEMTTRLGRQFVALRTLADIDRLMLASQDVEPVLEIILAHTRKVTNCRAVAIALSDHEARDIGRVYRLHDDATGVRMERAALASDLMQELLDHRDGLAIDCLRDKDLSSPSVQIVGATVGTVVLIVPVIPAMSVAGVVTALFDRAAQPDADTKAFLRDTADRLAVALANHDRQHALTRQAHYDGLTGLPNRELFRDRLDQELLRAARERHTVALLYVDLDRFKHVNDSTGHSAGDKLLKIAAGRMRGCVRDSDTVARLGGDEFTVVVPNVTTSGDAARTADLIVARLADPFLLDGVEHYLSASIGIACYPGDGETSEQLLKSADMAMYRAKSNGRGSYAFFEEQMNAAATQRLHIESQLHRAIAADEFVLHFQPQIDLLTGRVVAAEALVRWQHPVLGLVAPGHFIPLAEDSGLILQIGDWVIREALRQMRTWAAAGMQLSHMAVNGSTRQVRSPDFAEHVLRELERHNMPVIVSSWSITESGLMENIESAAQRLTRLRARGVRIAIDDFGTGYSSLYYLRDLPFDAIKIDRSFLHNVTATEGAAIADAVIAMAHALGKQVVAEGVELPAQLSYLRSHGCDLAQGYLFGRPVPAADFATTYLSTKNLHGAARSAASA